MQTFITAYLLGVISTIAVGIFIWTIRRGKGNTTGLIKRDIDQNNTNTRRGLEKLKDNNRKSGKIIDSAENEARRGLETIDDTNRSISEIINSAKRTSKKEPD